MRARYLIAGFTILLITFFIYSFSASAYSGQSPGAINESINQTQAYIQSVNESAYLVFYPNLTQAYGYLYQAKNVSGSNQTETLSLLNKATQSAQQQESILDSKRSVSAIVLAIITVICAAILYVVMKPKPKSNLRRQMR